MSVRLEGTRTIQRAHCAVISGKICRHQVIEEARQLAVKEHCVEFGSNLWVSESFATKGQRVKGMRRHAR